MSEELKPCPFCGAKPLMYDLLDTHGGFSIECPTDGCDAEKMKRTKEAAIAAWNTRAVLAPIVPQGWKLVPMEPTPEMVRAYLNAYRAMLAASPAPAADGVETNDGGQKNG